MLSPPQRFRWHMEVSYLSGKMKQLKWNLVLDCFRVHSLQYHSRLYSPLKRSLHQFLFQVHTAHSTVQYGAVKWPKSMFFLYMTLLDFDTFRFLTLFYYLFVLNALWSKEHFQLLPIFVFCIKKFYYAVSIFVKYCMDWESTDNR